MNRTALTLSVAALLTATVSLVQDRCTADERVAGNDGAPAEARAASRVVVFSAARSPSHGAGNDDESSVDGPPDEPRVEAETLAPSRLTIEERVERERQEIQSKIVEPFEAEDRSANWARDTEIQVAYRFSEYVRSGGVPGVSLASVECRASRCRVALTAESKEARARMQDDLLEQKAVGIEGCALHSVGYRDDLDRSEFGQELYVDCAMRRTESIRQQ